MGVDRPIDVTADQRKTVLMLVKRHLPNTTAWAYGSRVKWTSRPQSDLDLVVFTKPDQERRVSDLREAFEESNLPFRVDLLVWRSLPEQYRKQIETDHVVLVERAEQDVAGEWRETVYGRFSSDFIEDYLVNICNPIDGVQTGPFGSQLHQSDYVSSGTPIITVEHLGDNRILHEGVPHVSDHDRERLSKYSLHNGDIVFSRVGSVDRRALVRKAENGWLFSGRCLRVRPDPNKIDSTYLSYFFGLPSFKEHIRAIAVGATMPSLNTQILSDVVVPHPCDLNEQRAIAHVLGTLDDKIELNRRMNETLEAMARVLFKSWFIVFDPVHAKMAGRDPGLPQHLADLFPDRLVDSELGPIPEGWEVGCFGYVVEQLRDKENPFASPDKLFHHFSIPAFDEDQWPKVERGADIKSQKSRVLPGTVLLSKLNPEIERVWLIDIDENEQAVCSTEFLVLRPRPPYGRSFSYCLSRSPAFRKRVSSLVTGTSKSHQRAQADAVLGLPVVLCPKSLAESFEKRVAAFLQMTEVNRRESRTIAAQRDVLLPKLISGEIKVGNEVCHD